MRGGPRTVACTALDRFTASLIQKRGEKKAQVSLGFDVICHLLSDAGFSLRMGEEGLEPPTSTL